MRLNPIVAIAAAAGLVGRYCLRVDPRRGRRDSWLLQVEQRAVAAPQLGERVQPVRDGHTVEPARRYRADGRDRGSRLDRRSRVETRHPLCRTRHDHTATHWPPAIAFLPVLGCDTLGGSSFVVNFRTTGSSPTFADEEFSFIAAQPRTATTFRTGVRLVTEPHARSDTGRGGRTSAGRRDASAALASRALDALPGGNLVQLVAVSDLSDHAWCRDCASGLPAMTGGR